MRSRTTLALFPPAAPRKANKHHPTGRPSDTPLPRASTVNVRATQELEPEERPPKTGRHDQETAIESSLDRPICAPPGEEMDASGDSTPNPAVPRAGPPSRPLPPSRPARPPGGGEERRPHSGRSEATPLETFEASPASRDAPRPECVPSSPEPVPDLATNRALSSGVETFGQLTETFSATRIDDPPSTHQSSRLNNRPKFDIPNRSAAWASTRAAPSRPGEVGAMTGRRTPRASVLP